MGIEALARSRPPAGEQLPAIGRARRAACVLEGGVTAELWCVPAEDEARARRLVRLGVGGVGGFDLGFGIDAEGVFVLRRVPQRTLDSLVKGERLDPLGALAKVRDVARALAVCEREAIFPGPLRPSEIVLSSSGTTAAWILADSLVRAIVGDVEARPKGTSGPSPRWTPPAQIDGAPWDSAANRYVLGLAAYRALTGGHPSSGVGLRDALRAQSDAVPPFEPAVARTMRPGIQSLVLAMLAPDGARRPPSAEAIAARCDELLGKEVAETRGPEVGAEARDVVEATSDAAHRARDAAPRTRTRGGGGPSSARRVAFALAPIVVGVTLAVAGFTVARARSARDDEPRDRAVTVGRAEPLRQTTADACGACHTRQVAEWRRSVMAHSVKSPLFGALESVVEEQVGRSFDCPNGAGVLRRSSSASEDVCRDEQSGLPLTGAGGEHWCVNCHAAADNLGSTVPAWSARGRSSRARGAAGTSREPLRDVLTPAAMEGISCALCHQTVGPAHAASGGNPTWTSPVTGALFDMRPEDRTGQTGIGNSGYRIDASSFLVRTLGSGEGGDPIVHARPTAEARAYLASSEHCGACHDVRLFGTDSNAVRERGEHFKRLRNAYSEWRSWAETERAAGKRAASCQDCHMSLYPGVCVPSKGAAGGDSSCPPGFTFERRAPGERARGMIASSSREERPLASHFFTSVDLPLSAEFPQRWADDPTLDTAGVPLGLEQRREQLLRHTFRFAIGPTSRSGRSVAIPIEIENVGAGHRVPAGFSQEREIWVDMTVTDARGEVVYEVGKIASPDADLRDKIFLRTTTRDDVLDGRGRPLGVFGADIVDGVDAPTWSPNPIAGGTNFRGRGLVNLQNGFLRCVRCIGVIDAAGVCQPGPGQGRTRADRFADGDYDLDTGECRSNLVGPNAFFETYFPVGALDAERGLAKAPDAILDTRSAPPGTTLRYVYELDAGGRPGPLRVKARLRFRPFPPFLLRAFADYEARKAAEGARPSGPQLTPSMSARNAPIDLAEATATVD